MSMSKQMKDCPETFDPVHLWFKVSQEHLLEFENKITAGKWIVYSGFL